MEPTNLYKMPRTITDTDVDFARKQKLSSVFGYFQDIAALHAENLGGGVEWLKNELQVAWVLVRVRVEIDEYPRYEDKVIVETWPQTPKALYERDYRIVREDGTVLVRAASVWVIMDLKTREVKRNQFLDYKGIEINKDRALGGGFPRLKPIDGAKFVYEKAARYSDLDYNSHVNNAKYVDIALDTIPMDDYRKGHPKAFEIHYSQEAGAGDILDIKTKNLDDGRLYIEGIRKQDAAEVFLATVEF